MSQCLRTFGLVFRIGELVLGTQNKSPGGSEGGSLPLLLRPEMQGPDAQFASNITYEC
jgi:hypothetical protein